MAAAQARDTPALLFNILTSRSRGKGPRDARQTEGSTVSSTLTLPLSTNLAVDVAGIGAAEADLTTEAARGFLIRTANGPDEITMAAITYQVGTLFAAYTCPFTEPYVWKKSETNSHWCSIG